MTPLSEAKLRFAPMYRSALRAHVYHVQRRLRHLSECERERSRRKSASSRNRWQLASLPSLPARPTCTAHKRHHADRLDHKAISILFELASCLNWHTRQFLASTSRIAGVSALGTAPRMGLERGCRLHVGYRIELVLYAEWLEQQAARQ